MGMLALSQLKIGFLAGTLGQGGAEHQLFYILRALRQSNAPVHLFCLEQNEFWDRPIRELGVPITWIGGMKSKAGRLLRLVVELRKFRPAILQSQHFFMNSYAAAAAILSRCSSVGAMRSNGRVEQRDCGRIGGWLSLHAPRLLAANSQNAIQYAVHEGVAPSRMFLLSNVVDADQFRPMVWPTRETIRLISVGRLAPCKRFERFINLVAQLRHEFGPEIRGTLVGAGPLSAKFQAQAQAMGLPESALELRGEVSNVAALYQAADIFVLTSEYEGSPNVLLEAMASGLPAVATRVGGVPELLQHGQHGFLVEPDDDAGLGTALRRLIRDPQLRRAMGRNARAHIEAHYSLRCLPPMLLRLYGLALDQPRFRRTVSSPALPISSNIPECPTR